MDNFRTLKGYGWNNFSKNSSWKQDKGNRNCVKSFVKSLKTGSETIPIDEIFEVAEVSIELAARIHNQN